MNLFLKENFESVLLKNWTSFLDKTRLIQIVLKDAQMASLPISKENPPSSQLRLSITKFMPNNNNKFEVWIEFVAPKQGGCIVGTHVYSTDIYGEFELQNTYGTIFQF